VTITRVTIDASVFVSRLREDDAAHAESRAFLEALRERAILTFLPTLVRPEIVGAVRHFSGDAQVARRALEVLDPLPNLNFAPLDNRLANDAAALAAESGMKGADAVYVAVARLFDTTLVTLDLQQRGRAPSAVRAIQPAEALLELEESS
jgi:predicted nucleic acid-binding protein